MNLIRNINLLIILVPLFSMNIIGQNVLIEPSGITPNNPSLPYDLIVSIENPKEGTLIYDTTFKCLRVYNGLKWECSYKNPNDQSPDKALIFSSLGIGEEEIVDFETDSLGFVYILGRFTGTAKFGEFTKSSFGSIESKFILKLNLKGEVFWLKTIDGQSTVTVSDIEINQLGNIFFSGTFSNSIIFDGQTLVSNGEKDGFVFGMNSLGNLNFSTSTNISGNDYISKMEFDLLGNMYLLGKKETSNIINPTTNEYFQDIFLQKKNESGLNLWINFIGGEKSEFPKSIKIDIEGDVLLVGEFNETTIVGNQTLVTSGGIDFFIAKIQANGIFSWVKKGGSSLNDRYVSIDIDIFNNVSFMLIKGRNGFYFDNELMNTNCGDDDYLIINLFPNGNLNWFKGFSGCNGQIIPVHLKINRNGEYLVLSVGPIDGTNYVSMNFSKLSLINNSLLGISWATLNDNKGEFSLYKLNISKNGSIIIGGSFNNSLKVGNTFKSNFNKDIFLVRIKEN